MRCLVQLGSLDFADGSTWQQAGDDFIEPFHCVVLDEISGHRHLVISIGEREAFSLAARLQGVEFGRPMTYDFAAALVRGLGGHVRQVRVDRLAAGIYAAAVEVKLPFPDQSWFVRRLASCCLSAPQREGRCARPLAPPKICIPSTPTRPESNGSTPRSTAASGETTRAAGGPDYRASSEAGRHQFRHRHAAGMP